MNMETQNKWMLLFSMPWRLLAFPIAAGMLAHAARWARICPLRLSPSPPSSH
jgi:hypothetical protein